MKILLTIAKVCIQAAQHTVWLCETLAKVLVFSRSRPPIKRMRAPKTDACVILGNGPSLKETLAKHLDFLAGKRVMCMNDFAESPYFERVKPDYYIFADPTFWTPNASDRFKKVFAGYVERMRERVKWPMTIFLPTAARRWNFFMELPKMNPNITIAYFNTTEVRTFRIFRHWLFRKGLAIPTMQNVLVAAIFIPLNMGFGTIYVTGADHSWHEQLHVDENNHLVIKNTRFQDKQEVTHTPFYVDPQETTPFKMHHLFWAFSRMYLGYQELAAYAQERGAKIYNASEKSYIDAFERYQITP